MDFLKEIEPHNDRLDAYQKNKTFSGDVNALRDLARIYNKYVYQGKGDVKANLACGQCKAKMMDRLLAHRLSCHANEFLEYAKDVVNRFEEDSDHKPLTEEVVVNHLNKLWSLDYDSMKFQELKSMASQKGMNTYKKSKQDIIEWLKNN